MRPAVTAQQQTVICPIPIVLWQLWNLTVITNYYYQWTCAIRGWLQIYSVRLRSDQLSTLFASIPNVFDKPKHCVSPPATHVYLLYTHEYVYSTFSLLWYCRVVTLSKKYCFLSGIQHNSEQCTPSGHNQQCRRLHLVPRQMHRDRGDGYYWTGSTQEKHRPALLRGSDSGYLYLLVLHRTLHAVSLWGKESAQYFINYNLFLQGAGNSRVKCIEVEDFWLRLRLFLPTRAAGV